MAGSGKEFGAVGAAAIGEEALDLDAMSGVKADGLVESVEHAGNFFVGQEASEGKAAVIIDRDVQRLDAGARIAVGSIAGGADARLSEAAQLLDVEVEELARLGVFIAEGRRFGRFERRDAVEMMAAQDARKCGLGDGQNHHDLCVGTAQSGVRRGCALRAAGEVLRG